MSTFSKRTRTLEWWREENEVPASKPRLNEKYNGNFGPGWDGKMEGSASQPAGPAGVKGTGYAGPGDLKKKYDRLGPGKKTNKSSDPLATDTKTVKEMKKAPAKKTVREAFGEDEFEDEGLDDQGFNQGRDDFGGDEFGGDDVPAEFDDDMGGEGDIGGGDVVDDLTVEYAGQQYKLVPVEGGEGDEFGGEGDEFGGDELGGDEFGGEGDEFGGPEGGDEFGGPEEDDELARHGGVKAERKDLTRERSRRVREAEKDFDSDIDSAIEESINRLRNKRAGTSNPKREASIKKALQMKAFAEKKLKELFTGEYVLNKQGEPGFDFKDVGGEEDFAVADRASSGNLYTPTVSTSVYEPGADKKGGKTGHAKKVESAKEEFSKWLKRQESKYSEEGTNPDGGTVSDNFNKNDTSDKLTPAVGGNEDWANVPEEIANQTGKELITPAYEQAKRTRGARRTESSTKVPSAEAEETLNKNIKESFDFKAFLAGKYQS